MVNSWFNYVFWGKTMVNSWFNYVFRSKPWLIRGLTIFLGVNRG